MVATLESGCTDGYCYGRPKAKDIDRCIMPKGDAPYPRDEMSRAGALTDDLLTLEGEILENPVCRQHRVRGSAPGIGRRLEEQATR